jgi:hypothetical protein
LDRVRKGINGGNLFEEFVPIPKDYPENTSYSGLWGTKWDLPSDDYTVHDHGTSITLFFMSAWSPPIEVYQAMVEDGLNVDAKYHEGGMAFYGYFINGNENTVSYSNFDQLPEDIVDEFGLEDWEEQS